MRTSVLCCAVAAVGLAVGCVKSDSKSDPKATVGATQADAVAAYKPKLDEADKRIGELRGLAEKATGDEKVKLDARVKEATAKREAVGKKVDEVKAAAADKWEATKKDADTALDELMKFVK